MQTEFRPVYILSAVVALLMLIQSAGGLLLTGLYHDNSFVQCAWHGNDQVTLFIALPLLVGSLVLSLRGSSRAYLVLMGMLAYTAYNYGFYAFGAVLNDFFLIYVSLFATGLFGLVFGLLRVDAGRIARSFRARTPIRWVAGYMFLWSVLLATLWIFQSLDFVFTGTVPGIVRATAHPTNVAGVLDLTFMVPPVFLGAVWLWKQRRWGYLLALVMNVKGALYALVLAAGSYVGAKEGFVDLGGQVPLWLLLALASGACLVVLLRNLESGKPQAEEAPRVLEQASG